MRYEELRALIRDVPDFPKPGIVFKDLTPLLLDPRGLEQTTAALAERYSGQPIDRIAAIESRGFIFGAALAYELKVGLVLIRKAGKLPWKTHRHDYSLEYGTDSIEMHADAVEQGHRVLLVDDLLATGGTAAATCELIRRQGGEVVECAFVVELGFLSGRDRLGDTPVYSLLTY